MHGRASVRYRVDMTLLDCGGCSFHGIEPVMS